MWFNDECLRFRRSQKLVSKESIVDPISIKLLTATMTGMEEVRDLVLSERDLARAKAHGWDVRPQYDSQFNNRFTIKLPVEIKLPVKLKKAAEELDPQTA